MRLLQRDSVLAVLAMVALCVSCAPAERQNDAAAVPKESQPSAPAGWVRHEHERHRYAFLYPADWHVTTKEPEGAAVLTNFPYPQPLGTELTGNQIKCVIRIEANEQRLPASVWAAQKVGLVTEGETITIDGKSSLLAHVETELGPTVLYAFIPGDRRMFEISWMNGPEDQFRRILETFEIK